MFGRQVVATTTDTSLEVSEECNNMNEVMPDHYVDLNAGMHDDYKKIIIPVDRLDVACITETCFREYMDDTSLALEGFCLERKDRDHRRGGGVACYIRNDIEYNRLRELEDDMI